MLVISNNAATSCSYFGSLFSFLIYSGTVGKTEISLISILAYQCDYKYRIFKLHA